MKSSSTAPARQRKVSAGQVRHRLDGLTKPPRSLARLEQLAERLCLIQQTLSPRTQPRRLVLFAGDHGVAGSGVTAWPQKVTALMIDNIRSGGAASSVLARQTNTELVLVNVGTTSTVQGADPRHGKTGDGAHADGPRQPAASAPDAPCRSSNVAYRECRIGPGTRDLARQPAMTREEFERAAEVGRQEARRAAADGMHIVAAGEMGIGNTTPAACLAMLLADLPLRQAVGRGAGADDATLACKRRAVDRAVGRARRMWIEDPAAAIAAVSGFEMAAMAGFFIEAAEAGLTVLLDGYVTAAAALIARHFSPGVADSMIAAHRSAEPGHGRVLQQLDLQSMLEWEMRLGEGTGALLLMPLIDCATAITTEMATLAELGLTTTETIP